MRRAGAALAAFALAASALVAGIITAPAAEAAAPVEPATPFTAELCAGETSNPVAAKTLEVSGPRLDAYNAGAIVPLYDATGTPQGDAKPPLCTVYFDATTGSPVSVWMFCTNLELHTCGGTNGNNQLVQELNSDNSPVTTTTTVEIPFPSDVQPDHLDERQQLAIKALTAEGYTVADPISGTITGRSDGSASERETLQNMIWCVSDGGGPCYFPVLTEEDIDELAARGAELTAAVTIEAPSSDFAVGDQLRWNVSTNTLNSPMAISADSSVTICADSAPGATLEGNLLTVTGDADTTVTVSLCSTATEAGTYQLTIDRDGLGARFVQSENDGRLDRDCQVFGLYEAEGFNDAASITVLEEPAGDEEPNDEEPNDETDLGGNDRENGGATNVSDDESADAAALATTGSDLPVAALGIALIMLLGGAGLVLARKARAQS